MHIIDFYVDLFEEFQKVKDYFEIAMTDYNSKKQNIDENYNQDFYMKDESFEKHDYSINNFSKENPIQTESSQNKDQDNILQLELYSKESDKINNKSKISSSNITNKELANVEKIIRKIYLKLLLIFHPDKNISPNSIKFNKLIDANKNDDKTPILYFFIKEKSNAFISCIYKEIYNKQFFYNLLSNQSNFIMHQIGIIKSSIIWKEYYL